MITSGVGSGQGAVMPSAGLRRLARPTIESDEESLVNWCKLADDELSRRNSDTRMLGR